MSATTTVPARPNRTTVGLAGLAVAAAIATASVATLSGQDSPTRMADASVSAPAPDAVPMSPDAAEQWLVPDPVDRIDVRGMSPDAAERWLVHGR